MRGLADVVERRGVRIVEQTAAIEIRRAPDQPPTHGTVRADVVVRATEAFSSALPGHRRDLAPIYSLIVATEPLGQDRLAAVGLAERETFTDFGHLICYGQRTADGRIVFGGRGAPYHFGSSLSAGESTGTRRFSPGCGAPWSGCSRRWTGSHSPTPGAGPSRRRGTGTPSVGLDRANGLAWAGGYVGDGVSTANLAGRTLADLITGRDSALVRLPWVGHRSRRWEPEPLRFLGINAALAMARFADAREARTGRPSRAAGLLGRFVGG